MRSTRASRARSGIPSWKQKSASAGLIREHLGQVWGIAPSPSRVGVGQEGYSSCCTVLQTAPASLNRDEKEARGETWKALLTSRAREPPNHPSSTTFRTVTR